MSAIGGDKDVRMEVMGFVQVGVAILAMVSLYAGRQPELMSGHAGSMGNAAVGAVGSALASVQRGLVGAWGSWVLPILLLLKGIHTLMGGSPGRLNRRTMGCLLLYLAALGCMHLSNPNYLLPDRTSPDLWRSVSVAVHGNGGGAVGALISVLAVALFGVVGSYVLYGIVGVAALFLMVDTPFRTVAYGVRDNAGKAIRSASTAISAKRGQAYGEGCDDDGYPDDIGDFVDDSDPAESRGPGLVRSITALIAGWFPSRDKRSRTGAGRRVGGGVPEVAVDSAQGVIPATPFGVIDLRRSKKDQDPSNGYGDDAVGDTGTDPDPFPIDEGTGSGSGVPIGPIQVPAVDIDMQELISSGAAVTVRNPGKQGRVSKPTLSSAAAVNPNYRMPPLDLLSRPPAKPKTAVKVLDQSAELVKSLHDFGIDAACVGMDRGPHVTRYDIRLAPGTKYTKVANLEEDIALALEAFGVRISPIQGTGNIGIEVSNKEVSTVYLREVLEAEPFQSGAGRLTIGMGKDIAGAPVVVDLAKMVHTLISGATGSGKSVCVNTLVTSLLYKARPEEVRLLMIDPKVVELSVYNDIPHLLSPVITDPKQAAASLKWVVVEMERRYRLFAKAGVRHLDSFNQIWKTKEEIREMVEEMGYGDAPIPYIVVIVDELADLMMVASDDVEDAICRLAQKARAAGIHLVLATQRPSTDVITGLIKANIPSRIAFAVASSVDSRVILDSNGAERLLGKGDMLCLPMGANRPVRVQGAFISDREVEKVVEYVRAQAEPEYRDDIFEAELETPGGKKGGDGDGDGDELLKDAVRIVLETQHASASMLQRKLSVGYARAARLIDLMEKKGMVGPHQGSKPREIMINSKHLEDLSGS